MSEIKTFPFNSLGVEQIRDYKYGSDWPVVYLIEDGKELYVGETIRAYGRTKQHLENETRKKLNKIHVISDDEFNKSATLDTESSLIEYLVADGVFKLQNGNGGLQNHDYFDRERYKGKFELLWKKLQELKIANKDLLQIRNSDLFKYSPYKTLTDDQYLVASKLLTSFKEGDRNSYIIHGGPGTGKTILATYLIKRLVDEGNKNIALVIAMVSLRKTLKKVFRGIPGLSPNMVIGPNEVINNKYDILVVDEAHRLRQRRNIPNYGSFDETNKRLGFGNEGTELDWILDSANKVVLFYDEKQSVRPSDIDAKKILETNPMSFELKTQMRVKGGDNYIRFIDNLLENSNGSILEFPGYEFTVFDDLSEMITAIKMQEKSHTLSRLVAGYAWRWQSRDDKSKPDIVIGDNKLFWNSQVHDWVNSPNAINEVGCIHTIQGYDLNFAGVIIGPEISYDPLLKKIVIDRTKYHDSNGHRGIHDDNELKRYIINIYKTLLTRGILGTYLYVVDENLKQYIKNSIVSASTTETIETNDFEDTLSPYQGEVIELPLYDSVGCGEHIYADPTAHETYAVPINLVRPGAKYFVLRTIGDSMNLLGIDDGDYILCQKNFQAPSGSNAIVLIGDDATLKQIKFEEDGLTLIPKSSNPDHKIRKLTQEDEEFKVLGVFVCKL